VVMHREVGASPTDNCSDNVGTTQYGEPIAGHRSRACCPLRADGGIREVEAITART